MRVRFQKPITLTPKPKPITGVSKSSEVLENRVEFYDSRDCLSKLHPLTDVIKSSKVIWAFWFTGTLAHSQDIVKERKIERLILPHPTNSSLSLLANATNKSELELQNEVYAFTKAAKKENIQVRWYAGLTSSTMMLGEPGEAEGWIQVESVIPFLLPIDSPGFRIYRHKLRKLYDDLHKAYQTLWDNSVEPTPQDLEGH